MLREIKQIQLNQSIKLVYVKVVFPWVFTRSFKFSCLPCQEYTVSFWLPYRRRWFRELKFFRHLSRFLTFSLTRTDHLSCTSFDKHIWSVFHWCFRHVKIMNTVLHRHLFIYLFRLIISPFHLPLWCFQISDLLAYQSHRRNFWSLGRKT